MSNPSPFWQDMTTVDFSTSETKEWVAILPVAAIEQHGPHLPVATDTVIGLGMIDAVVKQLPSDLPATFLPLQSVGKSNEHISSPGTLTLSWQTATQAWIEIGESVARAGVRKLVIVTSHGGNVAIDDIIARELRVNHDMLVIPTSWGRQGQLTGVYPEIEATYGIHGGDVETSMMLHFRPDLVRMEHAVDFKSAQTAARKTYTHLGLHGPNPIGWKAQDLNVAGTVGNASLATADKGQKTVDFYADRFVELLYDVHRFPLSDLWTAE